MRLGTNTTDQGRRRLLALLSTSGGVAATTKSLPDQWVKPIVNSVLLPTHAQTSPASPPALTISCVGIDNPSGTPIPENVPVGQFTMTVTPNPGAVMVNGTIFCDGAVQTGPFPLSLDVNGQFTSPSGSPSSFSCFSGSILTFQIEFMGVVGQCNWPIIDPVP
ncbi:MAG: hypothetical protein OEU36_15625 [Gammaproteobacteria bacterium]|nr:hypothetical protein [Gammaproteobacteria bacterium]